mgnify:FL=1
MTSLRTPGLIIINSNSGEDKFFIEDGVLEFKNNNLTILTSSIYDLKQTQKSKFQELLKIAEDQSKEITSNDQVKFLNEQKIEILKAIN